MSFAQTRIDPFKTPASGDWHKAQIKCALELAGYTFRRLSLESGYGKTSIQIVIHQPWPKAERIVAKAIGVAPQDIWPSRYNLDGTPKTKRGEYKTRRASQPPSNHSTTGRLRNVKAAMGI